MIQSSYSSAHFDSTSVTLRLSPLTTLLILCYKINTLFISVSHRKVLLITRYSDPSRQTTPADRTSPLAILKNLIEDGGHNSHQTGRKGEKNKEPGKQLEIIEGGGIKIEGGRIKIAEVTSMISENSGKGNHQQTQIEADEVAFFSLTASGNKSVSLRFLRD